MTQGSLLFLLWGKSFLYKTPYFQCIYRKPGVSIILKFEFSFTKTRVNLLAQCIHIKLYIASKFTLFFFCEILTNFALFHTNISQFLRKHTFYLKLPQASQKKLHKAKVCIKKSQIRFYRKLKFLK